MSPESLQVATVSLHMNCVSLSYLLLYVDRRTRYIQDPAHLSPHPYAPRQCNPLYPKHSPNQNVCYDSPVDLLLDAATTPYIGIGNLLKHAAGTASGDPTTKDQAATQYGGISSLYHEPGAHRTTLDFTCCHCNSTCINPRLSIASTTLPVAWGYAQGAIVQWIYHAIISRMLQGGSIVTLSQLLTAPKVMEFNELDLFQASRIF